MMVEPQAHLDGAQPLAELDDISESFFEEGRRQEAVGHYCETPPPYRGSLDRVPRSRGPSLFLMTVLLSMGLGAAWFTGWLPADWPSSSLQEAAAQLVD